MSSFTQTSRQDELFQMTSYVFHLYIAGESANSVLAQRNLKTFCDTHYGTDYHIKLIDVLLSPEQAWNEGITATPMLLQVSPPSKKKIMGNLSDEKKLYTLLY